MENNTITILAIEDDPIHAETLKLLLEELGYTFHLFDNAIDGLKSFKQDPPDLLLMDIGINGPLNGIEFVEIVSAIRETPVIFVTAFSDRQIFERARQTMPAAYLLKPYNSKNLELAMELAMFQKKTEAADPVREHPYKVDKSYEAFFVKYNNKLIKVPINEVTYIEVEEKYCYLHTKERRYTVNIRLKNLLDQLPPASFVQTHRSFAVKKDAIEEVNLDDSVLKVNGREIPIGKTYKDVLFDKLKLI